MENKEFEVDFLKTIGFSKELKAVASYLLVAENPDVVALDDYVARILNKPDFRLWKTIRFYDGSFFENLIGFFKYFDIEMEKFIHDKTGLFLFEYLKNSEYNIRMTSPYSPDNYDTIKFTCNFSKLYFYHSNGYYDCYDLDKFSNRCVLLNNLLPKIIRLERKIDENWIPVVSIENGPIKTMHLLN